VARRAGRTGVSITPSVKPRDPVERAWLSLRTDEHSRLGFGYIAKRPAQLGERLSGNSLLSIVPLDRMRVEANSRRFSSIACGSGSR